jgi:hypothetical protein
VRWHFAISFPSHDKKIRPPSIPLSNCGACATKAWEGGAPRQLWLRAKSRTA